MASDDWMFKRLDNDGLSKHEFSALADLKARHNHAKACSKLLLDGWQTDFSQECPHNIELYWKDPAAESSEPIPTSTAFGLRNARMLQWPSSS